MNEQDIVDHILRRARWTASRSSGPGGQRRDKVETQAELTVDASALEGLDPDIATRLAEALGLDEQPVRMTCQDERSLARNQEIAADRFAALVSEALALPPPPRRPTRPSRARREARLAAKVHRGAVKRLRQQPPDAD